MTEFLERFDSQAECPKCGHKDVGVQYCEREKAGRICWCRAHDEHLHRHCQRCRYEWLEAVLPQRDDTETPPISAPAADEMTDREQAIAALRKAGWEFSFKDHRNACDVYTHNPRFNEERITVPWGGPKWCRMEMDVPPKDLPSVLSPTLADDTTALRLVGILKKTRTCIKHLGATNGSSDGYYRHIEELEADSRALRIAIKALGGEVTE